MQLDRRTLLVSLSLLLASGCVPGRRQASIMSNPGLAAIEKRIGGRLGVALVDSEGALITSHRGNERFAMCSTFKTALASAMFAAHAAGKLDIYATFKLKPGDRVPYMPFVKKQLAADMPVSLHSLAQAAVQTSDNAAANLILKAIGGPAGFTAFVRAQGDGVTRLDRMETELNENAVGDPRDTTSPVAIARLMHTLLIHGARTNIDKLTLQKWMKGSTTGGARIRAGLPKGWPVGDKTGTAPGRTAYNDVAIIWPSTAEFSAKPVILAVYTDRPKASAKKVNAAIADVGKIAAQMVTLPS